jgi:hypothetical protein
MALILAPVLCSLRVSLGIVKAEEVKRVRHGSSESLSESSESESLLYQASSSSSLLSSNSNELLGKESSDSSAHKSGNLNKSPKVAITKHKSLKSMGIQLTIN